MPRCYFGKILDKIEREYAIAILAAKLTGYMAPFAPKVIPVPAADRPEPVVIRQLSTLTYPQLDKGLAWLAKREVIAPNEVAGFPENAKETARTMSRVAGRPVMDKLNEAVRESMRAGEGAELWRKRLGEIANLQASLAETIQRTATHRAYHEGLEEVVKTPGMENAFEFYEYHATGDNRTRPEHQAMDGKIFHRDSAMAAKAKELLSDWNCRCTMVPMTREDAEEYGIAPGQEGPKVKPEGDETPEEKPQDLAKLLAEERRLIAEAQTIQEKLAAFESANEIREQIKLMQRDDAMEVLRLPKPMRAKVESEILHRVQKQTTEAVAKASDWFGEVLADRKFPNSPSGLKTKFDRTKGKERSHYKPNSGVVALKPSDVKRKGDSLVIHEVSHHLEDQKGVREAGRQFLESRFAKGQKPQQLRKLTGNKGYDYDEVTFGEDDFERVYLQMGRTPREAKQLALYVGRDYGKDMGYTEVISMGMELFHKDPGAFAKVDPDWFKLILGVLRGVF